MTRLFAVLLLVILTGCTREVVVNHYTTKYATLPNDWIADCKILSPPDRAEYNAVDEKKKLEMWVDFYMGYLKTTGQCNIRYQKARVYNDLKTSTPDVLVCKEGACK